MSKPKGNKNFMSLSKKECLEVAKETFRNSDGMYNDGVALAKINSFGRATSLLILSMEENMKAVILYLDGNGFQFRPKVKGIQNLFINHKLRYPLALVLSGFNIFRKDLREFIFKIKDNPAVIKDFDKNKEKWEGLAKGYFIEKVKQFIAEITWFSSAEYLRQEGMYVDYDDVLKTPLDINEQDYNEVYVRVSAMREFTADFLTAFDDRGEEGEEELKKQLKELQKQFITEQWYDKISGVISKFNSKDANPLLALLSNVQEFESEMLEDFDNEEE